MISIKKVVLPILVIFSTGCVKSGPENTESKNPKQKEVTQAIIARGDYGYVVKIKVDSSEYLIARGTECISIIKHK